MRVVGKCTGKGQKKGRAGRVLDALGSRLRRNHVFGLCVPCLLQEICFSSAEFERTQVLGDVLGATACPCCRLLRIAASVVAIVRWPWHGRVEMCSCSDVEMSSCTENGSGDPDKDTDDDVSDGDGGSGWVLGYGVCGVCGMRY